MPLILEAEFFYGAWNHRKADSLGIERDLNNWNQGIIGYPEEGSMDRKVSPNSPAGHSVLVVGYDDDAVVSTRVKMEDGSYKTFQYKGVYYFKNSWGPANFAATAKIAGVAAAGYGTITQKYAHEYGSFFKFSLPR